MTELPDHVIQEVLKVLLRHSQLQYPGDISLIGKAEDSASLESLETDEKLLESLSSLFQENISQRIVNIRRHRNSILPVYRLPQELLAIIFRVVQDDDAKVPKRYDVIKRLAGVSSHWFSTVLSTPNLWNVISSTYPSAIVRTCIKRSKSMALRLVFYKQGPEWFGQILELVMPHADRWGSLRISPENFVALFNHIKDVESLPQLEFLRVSGFFKVLLEVPNLVQRGAPMLRTLSIVPFTFPFGAPVLSQLQGLELTPVINGFEFSSHQWQTVLSGSPELKYIDIVGPRGMKRGERPFPLFHVLLPNLQRISIGDLPMSTMGALLSSIHSDSGIRPLVNIRRTLAFRNDNVQGLFPAAPPQSLLGQIRSMEWLSVICPDYCSEFVLRAGGNLEGLYFDFITFAGSLETGSVLDALVSSSGLPMLESLSLDGSPLFDGIGIIRALSYLPKLRKLDIAYQNLELHLPIDSTLGDIFRALSLPIVKAGAGLRWLLPELRDLGIGIPGTPEGLVPLIAARFGLDESVQATELPAPLEVLRLQNLRIRPGHIRRPMDPTLVTRLHKLLDPRSVKLEVIPEQ